MDAATYLIICIAFPLVALVLSGWGALTLGTTRRGARAARGEAAAGRQAPGGRRIRRMAPSWAA